MHMLGHNFLQTYTSEDACAYLECSVPFHTQLHKNEKILAVFHQLWLSHDVIWMVATTSSMHLENEPNTHICL